MLIEVLILILAVPSGFLIAYFSRDELIEGRKWFKMITVISAVIFLIFIFLGNYAVALTSLFTIIVAVVSYWKSFDKKWTKKI